MCVDNLKKTARQVGKEREICQTCVGRSIAL
jgi:hypothetical protein